MRCRNCGLEIQLVHDVWEHYNKYVFCSNAITDGGAINVDGRKAQPFREEEIVDLILTRYKDEASFKHQDGATVNPESIEGQDLGEQ